MECKKCLKVKDESVDQTSGLFWFTIATIFTRFSEGTRTPPNRRGPVEPCDFLYLPTLFINGAVANFVSPLQSFPIEETSYDQSKNVERLLKKTLKENLFDY